MTDAPGAAPSRPHRIFVYGTLKRGGENHAWLADQDYIGAARTAPGYALYLLDGYPGLVPEPADRFGVRGEVWAVEPAALEALDAFEGVHEGLYERVAVPLQPPFEHQSVEAYVYRRSVGGRDRLGDEWVVV